MSEATRRHNNHTKKQLRNIINIVRLQKYDGSVLLFRPLVGAVLSSWHTH